MRFWISCLRLGLLILVCSSFDSAGCDLLNIDAEAEIRTAVLANLDERLDEHLAQAENVRTLFMALNDELFENRVEATKLLGRLVSHNPAYAMPLLRKAVLQLMTELEYSTVK